MANGSHGISLASANSNLVGNDMPGSGNLISGNILNGVLISVGTSNIFQNNFIGTDAAGTAAISNGQGVRISEGAILNVIGTPDNGNLISGNVLNGVFIAFAQPQSNIVQANRIGVNVDETAPLANLANGVELKSGAQFCFVGGPNEGEGNVIAGNGTNGVHLSGVATISNTVDGNDIGVNSLGAGIPNVGHGVLINASATFNLIARNNIEANGSHGVEILGPNTNNNEILDNTIGSPANPNVGHGVYIRGIAQNNPITENTIRNNTGHGVLIEDESTDGNFITANLILFNLGSGVRIAQGLGTSPPAVNFIGGTVPQAANQISGNFLGGVTILAGTNNNVLGNVIDNNGFHGVRVEVGIYNTIRGNSIFTSVGGLGIDLGTDEAVTPNDPGDGDFGGNELLNYPVLTFAASGLSSTGIQGTLNSLADTDFTIEFFSNGTCDPSGFGEGQTFLGSTEVTTDVDGNVSFNAVLPVSVAPGESVTATATDGVGDPLAVLANTSEFSKCAPVTCAADVNGDGVVNVLDLIEVLLCFGQPAVPGCEAQDVNHDGLVNVLDLIEVLLRFGQPCV